MPHEISRDLPWRVPVKVDDIPDAGRHFALMADEATRAAVASYANIRSVEQLNASFDVTRRGRNGLHVSGEVRAVVGQNCVVSLEAIESSVVESIDVDFVQPTNAPGPAATMSTNEAIDDDAPEFLVDGGVDLGALAVEFLILGIDPYPRRQGVDFVAPKVDSGEASPFAALATLKQEPGKRR